MSSSIETRISGRYILQAKLGEGGMGAVYRATDRLTHETVALKRVTVSREKLRFASQASRSKSYDFRLALAQEFKTLASLRHPHIISVLDYGFDVQLQPFLTMELLEDAPTLINSGRDLAPPQQIELLVQLLQALAYLHRRGIIHRDLKPDNVLVIGGQVKVLDFGLAVAHEHLEELSDSVVGTLAYMAPEVMEGEPASEASDLYAVGVMAYELFAGQHPFDTRSMAALMIDIQMTTPDVANLPLAEETQQIIKQLLVKDPKLRYNDAQTLINRFIETTQRPELVVETAAIRESYLQAAEFVGREAEFNQLVQTLKQALAGEGSGWLIGGESGVGKSRLLDEVRTQALVDGALVLEGQAVSEGSTPYHVWREVVRRLCLETTLTDLEAGVLRMLVPDIHDLLGRAVPEAPALDPKAAYKRLLKVLVRLFRQQEQPLVVILEDMQWAGDESVGLLSHLTQFLDEMSLLLLASYRDDERPHLPAMLGFMESMTLDRLTAEDIAALSESMLGPAGRTPILIEFLQRETEGNTFFIVEVVRSLAEEAGQLDQVGGMELPQSISARGIQTIIERQLAQVGTQADTLLPMAAVAGRQLELDLLRHLNPEVNLENWLNRCAEARVLEVHEGRWRFAHDKLREAVIANVALEEQKGHHRQIAEAIEQRYLADLSPFYPRLAHHWSMVVEDNNADPALALKAIGYHQKAGNQAVQSSANAEAVKYFSKGLELLNTLPDTPERVQHELTLQIGLGNVLVATKGYAAPEVGHTYNRARELSQRMEDISQRFAVLQGLHRFYLVRAELQTALELGKQLLDLAQIVQEPHLLTEAHRVLGTTFWFLGEFVRALEHLEAGLTFYDQQQHRSYVLLYGQDPGVVCLAYAGWVLWCLGYPDQALKKSHEGIALARKLSHPYSLAYALTYGAWPHQFRQEARAVQDLTEEAINLATEQGFPIWVAMGTMLQGSALADQGNPEKGIAQIHQGLTAWRTTGAELGSHYFLSLLANSYERSGQIAKGLDVLAEALAAVSNTGRFWEAEVHRLKGKLLLRLGEAEVETNFRQAIEVARRQKAKSLELRAAVSLAQLWQSQGKQEEARQILEEIYNWFTEGFDTVDLKEARALVDELSYGESY